MARMQKTVGLILSLVLFDGFMPAARAADAEEGRAECCQRDKPQIARWQQNADRLYARFKPREAAGELQKVLQIDGENFAALIKLARSYIAVQDFPDARPMLKSIPALPIQFSDDAKHKEESAQLLQEIKDS